MQNFEIKHTDVVNTLNSNNQADLHTNNIKTVIILNERLRCTFWEKKYEI